jgi:hypothetical protein
MSPRQHCRNTQNYWGFLLRPLSSILKTKEHDVLESWSVSFVRSGGETPTLLDPIERAILNHWTTDVGRSVCQSVKFLLVSPAPSFLASVSSRFMDMYVVRSGACSTTKEGLIFLFGRYTCCAVVSAGVYLRCHKNTNRFYILIYTESTVNVGLYSRLCLNLLKPPKRQLHTWKFASLIASKFKRLLFVCMASPCPVAHTFGCCWLCHCNILSNIYGRCTDVSCQTLSKGDNRKICSKKCD